MENKNWYDIFLNQLLERYEKKSQLVEELSFLLRIEREAIYRRLRKEVPFLAEEIVKMAAEWNISLDEIVGIKLGLVPFQMQPLNYLEPSKIEMSNLQKRVKAIEKVNATGVAEYMEVSNKLPRPLYIGSMTLYRFEIFKWAYLYNDDGKFLPYSRIILPEKICKEFVAYQKNIKNISVTSFILDPLSFDNIVSNIKYFHSIMLITDEEKENLKKKLFEVIDYMILIADKGCYPETQKKVNLYISQLNIFTNYSYYYSEQVKSCRVHAFGKYDINSYDPEMVANFKKWMNLKKRASIQISEVNEKSRMEYFTKQREIVGGL